MTGLIARARALAARSRRLARPVVRVGRLLAKPVRRLARRAAARTSQRVRRAARVASKQYRAHTGTAFRWYRTSRAPLRRAVRHRAMRLGRVPKVLWRPVRRSIKRVAKVVFTAHYWSCYYTSQAYGVIAFRSIFAARMLLTRLGLSFVIERRAVDVLGEIFYRRVPLFRTFTPSKKRSTDRAKQRRAMLAHPMYGEINGIHLKERGRSYETSFKGPWGKLRYKAALDEGQEKKRVMWRFYDAASSGVSLDVPYVYVALHFQPERTTSSLGGVFGDQYLVVDMLARSVPEGWKVYVKEHPSQFYPPFGGERSRHIDFYRDIAQLPNVVLVSLSTSSFQLIDHARAVATVTGTVGWEAIIRGKPALVFGSSWYRYCEGAFFVPTEAALREALALVQGGYTPDPRRVRLFMLALHRVCARAGLGYNTPDEEQLGIPLDEAVSRLTAVLRRHWHHMQHNPPAPGPGSSFQGAAPLATVGPPESVGDWN